MASTIPSQTFSNEAHTTSDKVTNLTIVTYNLQGLNQGCDMLQHICSDICPDIILIQEHWKTPANLDTILAFSNCYVGFGKSAMEDALRHGVLRGRPFGGCAILVKQCYSANVKLLLCTDRVVIISIGLLMFINTYMPNKSPDVLNITDDILSEITGTIYKHSNMHVVLGGDLNCNIHYKSPLSSLFISFIKKHNLDCVDAHLVATNFCSYNHASLDITAMLILYYLQLTWLVMFVAMIPFFMP